MRREIFNRLFPYRDITGSGEAVTVEIPGAVAGTVFEKGELFKQCMTNAHCRSPLDLTGHQLRHNHPARINQHVLGEEFRLTGKAVDGNFDEASGGGIS